MAHSRTVKRVVIAPNRVRYKIRLTHDECPKGTHEAMVRQFLFVQWLANNYDLLSCGPSRFETLKVYHDGSSWIAEAEAEVDEPTDPQS